MSESLTIIYETSLKGYLEPSVSLQIHSHHTLHSMCSNRHEPCIFNFIKLIRLKEKSY